MATYLTLISSSLMLHKATPSTGKKTGWWTRLPFQIHVKYELKGTVTADNRNFYFIFSTLYCQMPPNTWISLIKNIPQIKIIEQVFGKISTDCKDGSGLQFIKLIFGQHVGMSKQPFWWNFESFNKYYFLVDISLLSPTFSIPLILLQGNEAQL